MNTLNKYRFFALAILATVLCLGGTSLSAQVLTNNGAMIYMNSNSNVRICGTANVNQGGTIQAQDSAKLRVDGTLNINTGTLTFNSTSMGLITVDLTSGGIACGPATGIINRNGTGTLTVQRDLNNNGTLNNISLIRIDGTLNNIGTVNNDSVIEVGQP